MTWDAAAIGLLAQRKGAKRHWLMWCSVRAFGTNAVNTFGFWTGLGDRSFTVDAASRSYFGGQDVSVPPIEFAKGVEAAPLDIGVGLTSEMDNFLRGYDLRDGTGELHCALFDPGSNELVSVNRWFSGQIDGAPLTIGEIGGQSRATLRCYSSASRGTISRSGFKSDASQRERLSTDTFRVNSAAGLQGNDPWAKKA